MQLALKSTYSFVRGANTTSGEFPRDASFGLDVLFLLGRNIENFATGVLYPLLPMSVMIMYFIASGTLACPLASSPPPTCAPPC